MIAKVIKSTMYTFRHDMKNTSTDISFVTTDTSGEAAIVSVDGNKEGRAYVLNLEAILENDDINITHEGFDITGTGTIEFYLLAILGSAKGYWSLTLYDGATRLVIFKFNPDDESSDFQYDNGGGFTNIVEGELSDSNVWYIVRIDVDIDAGVNGQFNCYVYDSEYNEIDSVTSIEFENNATTVDILDIHVEGGGVQGWYFMDNIGITAEGYTIGDIQYSEPDYSEYMFDNRFYNGIVPFEKRYTFSCHPDYESYFNEKDYIDIFEDVNTLMFTGFIKTKSRDKRGIYRFECDGMANEIYERTYDKSYSSDNTGEKQQDIIDNALKFCYYDSSIVATTTDYDYEYSQACYYLFQLARFLERQVCRIEGDGKTVTEAYNGITATGKSWTLYDGNQQVSLTDIKALQDWIPGYYKGNTGVTSAMVRYKDNTITTRPTTPSETFRKQRLKEFRDPKIQASTEANQLGDNLYAIFSADTIFLGLTIQGEGFMEAGQTIQIQNTKQITITQDDFLILSYIYDPRQDLYLQMVLSDNIITPREFKTRLDTSKEQVNTATTQSFENQADIAALCMYGAANKAWIPCTFTGTQQPGGGSYTLSYQGSVSYEALNWHIYDVKLPTNLGDYKLYIDAIKIGVFDADANDYVDNILLVGHVYDLSTDITSDPTNRTTQGEYTSSFTVEDLSSYDRVVIAILNSFTGSLDLDINFVSVRVYYNT